MRDPFKIEGPAAISFSGGRTSAYMLWSILQSHGGKLPDDVAVVFANTGREHEATLRFVRECAVRWRVRVRWVEFAGWRAAAKQHRRVAFRSASRKGEPFDLLLAGRPMLPNTVASFCSSELKTRTMHRFIREELGWDEWDAVIGLRADEPRRVSSIRARGYKSDETAAETICLPLAEAGIGKHDVMAFWQRQPFDLQLPNIGGVTPYGNCVHCFKKQPSRWLSLIAADPAGAQWWADWEQRKEREGITTGARFADDRPSYTQAIKFVTKQQASMFGFDEEEDASVACACTD